MKRLGCQQKEGQLTYNVWASEYSDIYFVKTFEIEGIVTGWN